MNNTKYIVMAVMQTPHRFRTKRPLWNYAGLSLVTRSSVDYGVVGVVKAKQPYPG